MATSVDIHDVIAASLSDIGGKRDDNQDLYGDFRHGTGGRLLVLADGMGGRGGGANASRTCVDALADYFRDETGTVEERLVRCFERANSQILELSQTDESLEGMGTTGVALLFSADGARVAWVGDSRAYRWRTGILEPLTQDHSLVQEWVRTGVLSAEEAASHPRRNELLRAIGIGPGLEVDVCTVDVRAGDRFLLCSDGLSGVVPHEEITAAIGSRAPEDAARQLVERAKELRGTDNITVQVAAFGADLRAAGESEVDLVPPVTEQVEAALRRRDRRGPALHGSSALFGAGAAIFLSLIAFSYLTTASRRSEPEPRPYPLVERKASSEAGQEPPAMGEATGAIRPRPRAPEPAEIARAEPPKKPQPQSPLKPEPAPLVEPVVQPAVQPAAPKAVPANPAPDRVEEPSRAPRRENPSDSLATAETLGLEPGVHAFVTSWLEAAGAGDVEGYRALGFPISDEEFDATYGRWEDFRVKHAEVDESRSRDGRIYLRIVLSYAFHDPRGRWRTEDDHRVVLAETPDGLRYHARWR